MIRDTLPRRLSYADIDCCRRYVRQALSLISIASPLRHCFRGFRQIRQRRLTLFRGDGRDDYCFAAYFFELMPPAPPFAIEVFAADISLR